MHLRRLLFAVTVSVGAVAPASAQADAYLHGLKRASCPQGVERQAPQTIDLGIARVPLQGVNPGRKTIGDLTLVGGFHLTSPDARFGGLSGLDLLDDGSLLAVSDAGSFVWIALADDGVTPTGASIASMRDATGAVFSKKSAADAEGLAVTKGVALVSFEVDHRVLAYDLDSCGAAAHGIPVIEGFAEAFARQLLKVGTNEGLEALAVTEGGVLFAGLEAKTATGSAISARALDASPEFDLRLGKGAPELVGLDVIADGDGFTAYSLHRSTNAMASSVIEVFETRFARASDDAAGKASWAPVSAGKLASMNLFVTIDNFEGVAARRMPDGRVRLYVVSDNNFAARQRTLLMVYDVAERG